MGGYTEISFAKFKSFNYCTTVENVHQFTVTAARLYLYAAWCWGSVRSRMRERQERGDARRAPLLFSPGSRRDPHLKKHFRYFQRAEKRSGNASGHHRAYNGNNNVIGRFRSKETINVLATDGYGHVNKVPGA